MSGGELSFRDRLRVMAVTEQAMVLTPDDMRTLAKCFDSAEELDRRAERLLADCRRCIRIQLLQICALLAVAVLIAWLAQ